MMKRLPRLLYIALFLLVLGFVCEANAQNRKAVSAAEVNGTFRSYFKGRFKDSYNEIRILALGKGKVKIAFDLLFPHLDSENEFTANLGTAEGIAEISGDKAVFTKEEFGACKIIITFVKPGVINVVQSEEESDCGFGYNVWANGTYKKVSGAKPKF